MVANGEFGIGCFRALNKVLNAAHVAGVSKVSYG
jgi:hypothetical protein